MNTVDINEKALYDKHPAVLELLLLDNTTRKNIIWATESYRKKGYRFNDNISPSNITDGKTIKPRSKKARAEKTKRSKDSAEVFTPSWVCNKQNNLIDEIWFNRKNVFNTELDKDWVVSEGNITMPAGKDWIDYVKDIRLEISCGEAPYIVSRYDSVTGDFIETPRRIGFLDRKFRIIKENCKDDEEWKKYSLEALKATYGFEWQGDNLILARENVLYSFIDYYTERFGEEPDEDLLIEAATIISWNLWQMDGIKCVIPNSCKAKRIVQMTLFGEEEIIEAGCKGCIKETVHGHNGIYSKIMDWEKNKKIKYVELLGGMQ